MTILSATSGTLGSFNVGLAVAAGLINPLSAQLDALLAIGLGPFMAEISASFNASLAASATLSLQIGNPLASLQLAISALAQLQAALIAALSLPSIELSISAELSASVALAAALSARIGLLKIAIAIALEIKLGAVKAAADLALSLNAGPVAAASFGGESFAAEGAKIASLMQGNVVDGKQLPGITGSEPVSFGIILIAGTASVGASLNAIIQI